MCPGRPHAGSWRGGACRAESMSSAPGPLWAPGVRPVLEGHSLPVMSGNTACEWPAPPASVAWSPACGQAEPQGHAQNLTFRGKEERTAVSQDLPVLRRPPQVTKPRTTTALSSRGRPPAPHSPVRSSATNLTRDPGPEQLSLVTPLSPASMPSTASFLQVPSGLCPHAVLSPRPPAPGLP